MEVPTSRWRELLCLDGMKPDSHGLSPAQQRVTALAGLAQRDGNGLLDRFLLCQRMAGSDRPIVLPVLDQCLDIAAYDRPDGSLSERHDPKLVGQSGHPCLSDACFGCTDQAAGSSSLSASATAAVA
jgi:hypothetical protein